MHLMGAATFLEIWAPFLYVNHHSEFLGALTDVCRNNNVLFNAVIYKEGTKRPEKYNRLSQPELSFLSELHASVFSLFPLLTSIACSW